MWSIQHKMVSWNIVKKIERIEQLCQCHEAFDFVTHHAQGKDRYFTKAWKQIMVLHWISHQHTYLLDRQTSVTEEQLLEIDKLWKTKKV